MFCNNCGTEIEENAEFCDSCGKSTEVATTPTISAKDKLIGIKEKYNIKTQSILIAVFVLLLIGVATIISINNTPGTILKKYMKATENVDLITASKYMAYDFDNLIKEMYTAEDMTEKEFNEKLKEETGAKNIKDYMKQMKKEHKDELKEFYDGKYKLSYKIGDKEKVSKSEMNERIEDIEDYFDRRDYSVKNVIKLNKIKKMVDYEVEITVKVSSFEETITQDVTMVKIGSKWYVFEKPSSILGLF